MNYINPYKISKDDEQLNAFYIFKMKFARQQQIVKHKGTTLEVCKNIEYWLNTNQKVVQSLLPYFYKNMDESRLKQIEKLRLLSEDAAQFKEIEFDLFKNFIILKVFEIIKKRRNRQMEKKML